MYQEMNYSEKLIVEIKGQIISAVINPILESAKWAILSFSCSWQGNFASYRHLQNKLNYILLIFCYCTVKTNNCFIQSRRLHKIHGCWLVILIRLVMVRLITLDKGSDSPRKCTYRCKQLEEWTFCDLIKCYSRLYSKWEKINQVLYLMANWTRGPGLKVTLTVPVTLLHRQTRAKKTRSKWNSRS